MTINGNVTLDSRDRIFLSDTENNEVLVLTGQGDKITKLGAEEDDEVALFQSGWEGLSNKTQGV